MLARADEAVSVPTLGGVYPSGHKLHSAPDIDVIDGVLAPEERHHLITAAVPRLMASQVSGDKHGQDSVGRTNSVGWVPHRYDSVTKDIAERIADIVGVPLHNAEALQVVRYDAGQEYRPHFDAYVLDTERGRRCCRRGGQRLVTVLGYLSSVENGGQTVFPRLGLSIDPVPGRLLIFQNCIAGERTRHPNSLHQGARVLKGRKWAFNMWFHERQFQS